MSGFIQYIFDWFKKDKEEIKRDRRKESKYENPYEKELSDVLVKMSAYHTKYIEYATITEENASIVDNISRFFHVADKDLSYEKKMDVYREMYIYIEQWEDFFSILKEEELNIHYCDDGYFFTINEGFTPLYIKLLAIRFDVTEEKVKEVSDDFITLDVAYNKMLNYSISNGLKESNKASSYSSF